MSREEAKEIARRAAKQNPPSYYAEPFEPHEWVIDAILDAERCGYFNGYYERGTEESGSHF